MGYVDERDKMSKNFDKKFNFQQLLAPAALVLLYIFFSVPFISKTFFSLDTLVSILDRTYYVGFLAFGVTFVIISGGIDLSIGTNMMMSALIGGFLINNGVNIPTALICVVLIATLVGAMNGVLIARLKLPPFIATLGMMLVTQGVGSIVTKVTTQHYPAREMTGDGVFLYGFKDIFYKTSNGFPSGGIYMLLFFIVAYVLLTRTRFGNYTFALGSNEEAMRLSGVNTVFWKSMVFTVCGFFAGLGAIVYSATYTTIVPGKGNGIELDAIAAVIIGGTSMSGGAGSISGTLIGALLMSVLKTGLVSAGLQADYQLFFSGLVVILAVLLDIYRNKRAEKSLLN